VSITHPFQRAPVVEASEEALPGKRVIGLVKSHADANAIIDELTEEFEL
jgi:hypothetical protein